MNDPDPPRSRPPGPTFRRALFGPDTPETLPAPPPRDYPAAYVAGVTLRDGAAVTVRPIRPDDAPLMVRFHEELGEDSIHFRYAGTFPLARRTERERLIRRCTVDYHREMALIAEMHLDDGPRLLGVARLIQIGGGRSEFGLVVADRVQRLGLGTELLTRLIAFARDERLATVEGDILGRNHAMIGLVRKLGFEVRFPESPEDPMVRAVLRLPA